MRAQVEQVIQTATKLVEGHLTAREALTILATLTRDAVLAARDLRVAEPVRADAYQELILVIEGELRGRQGQEASIHHHLDAVLDDLAAVRDALG